MQIIGTGCEIVECLRIGRMIERHGEQFLLRVYTEREILFCRTRRRSVEYFAAYWAAKEAVLKALGTPWRRGLEWTDLEVRQGAEEVPKVHLCGSVRDIAEQRRVADVMLSIAHCRAYATAHAIAVAE